jgi:O-antigen ligase
MFGTGRTRLLAAAGMIVIAGGLFLSFSRGAWGHFAASAAIFFALSYVTRRSVSERARIVAFAVIACIALVLLVLALLSLPQVSVLFEERSRLMQSYDAESTGRFGRHILGALLMLDHPFGIGPMQFTTYFSEDPHNSVLAAFAAGGWLAGLAYIALIVSTVVAGFRQAFVRSPLQQRYIAVYATFLGAVGESYIIDVLHWRHFFMLIGVLWGLMVASRRQERGRAAPVVFDRSLFVGFTR